MTDREKLVGMIDHISEGHVVNLMQSGGAEELADYMISNGVRVEEMQKPLTVEELVKPPKVVYVECTFFVEMHAALTDCLYETPPCLGIQFVGFYEKFKIEQYGKTWRCWGEKPTEEERKAAEWEK